MVEGCKSMFSILHVCTHFVIVYQARITFELHSEIGAIDVNQRFLVIESNFC